ncbi:MAG: hypothetical protein A4S09_10045 [Proteobacteria bacterium SG_bin7]|nr:MAG: hypothetical protein A4S09_10045 [Proteobacteria bacterium SG_bin7]
MLTLQLFRKFLFSKRSGSLIRTISRLCIFGIGVGVFALILVNSIMNGFHGAIRERLLKVEPHLVVRFDKKEFDESKIKLLESLRSRNDTGAYLLEQQDVMIRTSEGIFSGAVAVGVDEEPLYKMLKDIGGEIRESPVISTIQDTGKGEIFVGKDLAYTLGLYEGDEVLIVPPESLLTPTGDIPIFEQAVVRGIISTSVADIDAKNVYYVRGKSLKRLRKSNSFTEGIEIRLKDPMNFSGLMEELKKDNWKVESWVDRNSTLFFALKVEKTVIAVFLALSTLIASFSVITVLTLLLAQKKREFGVLMALGVSLKRARLIFSNVGLMLAGVGLGAGLVLGTGISLVLQKWPLDVLPNNIYYDTRITAQVDFTIVAIIFAGSIVIAFFSAWIAATQILKTDPISGLRAKAQIQI